MRGRRLRRAEGASDGDHGRAGGRDARLVAGLISALALILAVAGGVASGDDGNTVSPTEAAQQAAQAAPDAVAPSTAGTVGTEQVDPSLTESGSGFSSTGTAADSTIPKQADGPVTLQTDSGALTLEQKGVSEQATTGEPVAGGDAVAFANTAKQADTIVRPTASGVETFTSIRGDQAPADFSWKLGLPQGTTLVKKADGSVDVVDPAPKRDTAQAGPAPDPSPVSTADLQDLQAAGKAADDLAVAPSHTDTPADAADHVKIGEETATSPSDPVAPAADIAHGIDEQLQAQPEPAAAAPAPADPVSPLLDPTLPGADPTPASPPLGAEQAQATPAAVAERAQQSGVEAQQQADAANAAQPADEQASDKAAQDAAATSLERAKTKADDANGELHAQAAAEQSAELAKPATVAKVTTPWAVDANGQQVPSSLSIDADNLTLNVDHGAAAAAYPVVADPWIEVVRSRVVWDRVLKHRWSWEIDHYETQRVHVRDECHVEGFWTHEDVFAGWRLVWMWGWRWVADYRSVRVWRYHTVCEPVYRHVSVPVYELKKVAYWEWEARVEYYTERYWEDDPTLNEVDYDPADGPDVSAAAKGKNQCKVGPKNPVPSIRDKDGEPNIIVHTHVSLVCPVGMPNVHNMHLEIAIQKRGGSDNGFHDWKVETGDQGHPFPALVVDVDKLCASGTHEYRTEVKAKVDFRPGSDLHDHYHSDPIHLNCNEAGAWRYLAHFGNGSPSRVLGDTLDRNGDHPPGPDAGWEAHHIIPAGQESGSDSGGEEGKLESGPAALAEAAGYACDINPNGVDNGVWLRGPRLKGGTPGYDRLPEAGKRRAYHRTIHTQRYFEWVRDGMLREIHDNWTCDPQHAVVFLHHAKNALENDNAPH